MNIFEQIDKDDLIPVKNKSRTNARLYYIFETKKEGKILNVTIWGNEGRAFINVIEVKGNKILH